MALLMAIACGLCLLVQTALEPESSVLQQELDSLIVVEKSGYRPTLWSVPAIEGVSTAEFLHVGFRNSEIDDAVDSEIPAAVIVYPLHMLVDGCSLAYRSCCLRDDADCGIHLCCRDCSWSGGGRPRPGKRGY